MGQRLARELVEGVSEPDVELGDVFDAARWIAARYRTVLAVGDELDLGEAVASWARRLQLGQWLTITVAQHVVVVVPVAAMERAVATAR